MSITIGVGVALAGPAAADPPRVPLALQCDALGSNSVTVPAAAPYSLGLDAGSTRVGMPYALTETTTFTPVGGEPRTSVDRYSKPAPANSRHDRCTFHDEGSNEAGTFTLDGKCSSPTHRADPRADPMSIFEAEAIRSSNSSDPPSASEFTSTGQDAA